MRRILIAGCGYVGAATADLFHDRGWAVEGWTSSSDSVHALAGKPFLIRAVDVTDGSAVAEAGGEFDAIIQCVSSRGGTADDYRRIYLHGAQNLATRFPRALLLFTSSTSVYAQTRGEWVDETSTAEPQREAGCVLRETEELVLSRGGIVARLAGIYGPGRSALLRKFLEGRAVIDGRNSRFINQVHRDDIASALHLLVEQHGVSSLSMKGSGRKIFNVADSHPHLERECYEWLASHLSRPIPPTSVAALERKRGNSNKRVSSAKLSGLGWMPRFPDFASGMSGSVLPELDRLGA